MKKMTKAKQAMKAAASQYKDLKHKYKLLTDLMDHVPDVIYFKDKDGKLMLVNKAHAKGLGAVWLGVYPKQERVDAFRELLGLPEHLIPLAVVSLGYPAEEKPPSNRYDPARVRYNRWS